jgi:phenylacetate-CoA ligase
MHDGKLNELVQYVRKNSPFYGELYLNLPDQVTDVTQLPVIDHTQFWDVNTVENNRILTAPLTEAIVYKTGGSTGAPKFTCYTRGEWDDFATDIGMDMVRNGFRHGHRVANLFYAGELYASFMLFQQALTSVSMDNVRLPVAGSASPEVVHKVLVDFDVEVVLGTPTSLCRVANYLLEQGVTIPSVEFVFFSGEPVFSDQRRLLAAAFPNVEIVSLVYGSVDGGLIGHPLRGEDQRVFRAPDRDAIVEILDDATGEPIRESGISGRLVKTDLRRRLMPILRYPVGDRAEWLDYESGLFRLNGRHDEGVRLGPVSIYTEDVRQAISELTATESVVGMQLVAERAENRDGLVVRLVATPDFTATEAAAAELVATLDRIRPMIPEHVAAGMINPVTVVWKRYDELEVNPRTGKLRTVVDNRPTD